MSRHWQGLWLSLVTAFMWGVLPAFLLLCLQQMDSSTITWYRFAAAGVFVFVVLTRRRALPVLSKVESRLKLLLLFGGALLVLNYVANVEGLEYISPETAQVVMQLAPLLLMAGGIVFYREKLTFEQAIGALILVLGLILFFNQRLSHLLDSIEQFTQGVLIIVFAAVCWAGYALTQKTLLRVFTARQLTGLIYLMGVIALLPFADLVAVQSLNFLQLFALVFCCVNTIIAYGAFTEAIRVWDASKVSAVLALTPLFTFVSMKVAVIILPTEFSPSELDFLAYVGGFMVVAGSATVALGKPRPLPDLEEKQ